MGTVTTAVVGATKLITFGLFLGIGFWASKKITNKLDDYFLLFDKKKLEKIVKDIKDELK